MNFQNCVNVDYLKIQKYRSLNQDCFGGKKNITEYKEKENLKEGNKYLKILNDNLKNENRLLKNEIQLLKKGREDFKIQLDKFNLIKDKEIKKLKEKYIKLDDKIKILDNLILKMKNVMQKTTNDSLSYGEKYIAINFVSFDQRINHSVICKNKTNFQDVEREIYLKYPEYIKNNNYLMYNGLSINKSKTLEENGINGYTIILNKTND